MRRLLILLLTLLAGCQACPVDVPVAIEAKVSAISPVPMTPSVALPPGPLDLPALWALALANNPTLREAAADVEVATGQVLQASKCQNPRLSYMQQDLGTRQNAAGALIAQLTQEIVTAGKRDLDVAIAAQGTDAANVALLGRKWDVLARVRRLYYEYLGWGHALRVNEEVVADLERGVQITRRQVEEVKNRPRSDLVRLQALSEEARSTQARNRVNRKAAWHQLAAEVGRPELPLPDAAPDLADSAPSWDRDTVSRRVLAANSELQLTAVEAERARLEVDRARAEAVPNVTVGTGYSRNFAEREEGAVMSVEMALPVWDRKQGRIHEAEARWAKAQAARQSAVLRLNRETAEAFGRFEAARRQMDLVTREVLPRLRENLALVREGYQAGAAQVTFADVVLAEQTLNETRLRQAEVRRDLWRAAADLQGLMQLDVAEGLCPLEELSHEYDPAAAVRVNGDPGWMVAGD